MPPIVKVLLPIVAVVVVVFIGFQIHALLGWGLIVVIIGTSLYSSRSIIYANRGNMAFMRGDEEKAREWLEKAYRTKRALPQQLSGYAFLLNRAGQPEQAQKILEELLSKPLTDDNRISVSVNLATAYWLQGRQEDGYKLLEDLYPEFKNTQLFGTLGYYKLLRGDDPEEVLEFNKEAYDYNDDDLTILDNLAQNYYFLGRLEEAKEMYAKVMEKKPKSADSYYFYAMTLKKLGLTEEAREQIALAQERDPALVTPLTKEDIEKLAEELGA